MKKTLSFTVEMPKRRMHKALFDDELPFKPKVVKPKNQYKRRPKHKNKLDSWDE